MPSCRRGKFIHSMTNSVDHLLSAALGAEDTSVERERGPRPPAWPGGTRRSTFEGHSQGHPGLPRETRRKEQWIKTQGWATGFATC